MRSFVEDVVTEDDDRALDRPENFVHGAPPVAPLQARSLRRRTQRSEF